MKTCVDLDENKVKLAKELGRVSTLKELLDHALEAYIKHQRRMSMIDLLGSKTLNDNISIVRKARGRSHR